MSEADAIVLGGTGLIGSAVCAALRAAGHDVLSVHTSNYDECRGARARVLINCAGNSFRYKAAQDPRWDFDASVASVQRSLFDFEAGQYVYVSTIDVYDDISDPAKNSESSPIDTARLHPYGFHKWLAERLVERFGRQPLILRMGTVIGRTARKGPLYDLLRREPLHMSPDSEISCIDTGTLATAITRFIADPPDARILNLTGTGGARLRSLCDEFGLPCAVAPGAESVQYHYDINNAALRSRFHVPSSYDMAARLLRETVNA